MFHQMREVWNNRRKEGKGDAKMIYFDSILNVNKWNFFFRAWYKAILTLLCTGGPRFAKLFGTDYILYKSNYLLFAFKISVKNENLKIFCGVNLVMQIEDSLNSGSLITYNVKT